MKVRQFLRALADESGYAARSLVAGPNRYYGGTGTIHHTLDLAVETHGGRVVSVWYRCQLLPFHVREVERARAEEMDGAYRDTEAPGIAGIELEDNL